MKPMLLNQRIVFEDEQERITDLFVRGFEAEGSYEGVIARIVANGVLPVGVNEKDSRVKEIMERCRAIVG